MKRIIFILALIYNLTFAICNCYSQWSQVNLPVTGTIQKVQFINQNTGWLLLKENSTKFTLLKSTNGGINWSAIYADSSKLMTFQFVDDSVGYGMGRAYIYGLLSKTTNGGNNWTIMQSSSTYVFDGFYFINQDTGWVNAWNFSAYNFRTTNGLQSMELISSGSGGTPCDIKIFSTQYNGQYCGYMGSNGYLWKTTNSGYNWTQLNFSGIVYGFSFINKDTGWVNMDFENSSILKTTNAGTNWNLQFQGNRLNSIFAVNANKLWCGADHNYIQVSTNGGIDWGRQLSPVFSNYNIYMYDTSLGFAWSGIQLVRTTNGGGPIVYVRNIAGNTPDNYKLKQNYPNPFNQSTIISYRLKNSGLVRIKIFDVTGKIITTLVNERKTTGTHDLIFDAGTLASGIYFYSLLVNDKIVETKKMIYNK